MIYEVRITTKNDTDPKGQDLLAEIKRTLKINGIRNIRAAKVYRLEGISQKETEKFTQEVLFESINQKLSVNGSIFKDADHLIEVAYKPGVMNPEAASILKSAKDLGINLKAADSSWEYAFFGKIADSQISTVIKRLLVNETIEQLVKKPPKTLLITGKIGKVQIIPIRKMSENQLMDLSKDRLFLNLEEMKIIQNYFKGKSKDPTDCEIEVLAQTWSEHCGHKTFKAKLRINGKIKKPLIQRIKQTAQNNKKLIVSAFEDNSGVIDFYDGWAICGKVETHNSPSAIEPYGGAMTGSGGVFRDILGTGHSAKPIASTDIFCFAPPDLPTKLLPPGCLPPDYLFRRVVAGVRDYGNRVGIPTNNGSVHFHEDFRAKPTVAVGSYGLIRKDKAKKQSPKVGDLIITIGGRTGRDGIHGATFSSGEMTDRTINVSGSAVQIGNAIEEKRVIDAVIDLSKEGLIRAITDCGAGGYSSAVGEMGQEIGAKVFLEKIPLKYPGLAPWEIFLSESQERMVLAISPQNLKKALKILKLYNVEASVIGKFGASGQLKVFYHKQTVCHLDMNFLHHGLPQRKMVGTTKLYQRTEKLPSKLNNFSNVWQKIMAHPNVCSKEPIIRMYDHNVQGTNALHPLGGKDFDAPNDGVILKPILNKPYGVIITHGLNPILNRIDPYWGSIWAIVEAVSNFVAIGGDLKNAALIDNFIWPFPDEESLADLDQSVDACYDIAKLLKMPFISGKDSLSSTYRYPNGKVLKVPPVLLISVFGKIPDVKKTASADFKLKDSTIVFVGRPDTKNLGGSIYFDATKAYSPTTPKIDLTLLNPVLKAITKGIKAEQILSAHDISEGGLAVCIAEMCFGGEVGAEIDLAQIGSARPDFILFNETAGTFLVEVKDEKTARELFTGIPYAIIGKTTAKQSIEIKSHRQSLCQMPVAKLKTFWQKPMKEIFH